MRLEEGLEEGLAEELDQSLQVNQHQCLETVVRQNQMTCVCSCQNLMHCFPHEILNLDVWQLEVECYQVVVKDALLPSPV